MNKTEARQLIDSFNTMSWDDYKQLHDTLKDAMVVLITETLQDVDLYVNSDDNCFNFDFDDMSIVLRRDRAEDGPFYLSFVSQIVSLKDKSYVHAKIQARDLSYDSIVQQILIIHMSNAILKALNKQFKQAAKVKKETTNKIKEAISNLSIDLDPSIAINKDRDNNISVTVKTSSIEELTLLLEKLKNK